MTNYVGTAQLTINYDGLSTMTTPFFMRSELRSLFTILLLVFAAVSQEALSQTASLNANLQSQSATDYYVISRSNQYNYVPDAIYFNGNYHLYWCGSVSGSPGDHILHAMSTKIVGPYHSSVLQLAGTYDISLAPTGSASFDGQHVCDPSVIQPSGTSGFFLYYGGAALNANGTNTAIGVAGSMDGIHFVRLNSGQPIIKAANTSSNPPSKYGAGQPAIFFYHNLYYLSFTDTTGSGANQINGAGQFLVRSTSPSFAQSPQELSGPATWVADQVISGSLVTTARYAYLEAFSVDIAYDALSNKLLVGTNQVSTASWVYLLDPSFSTTANAQYVAVPGTWRDGPSILKTASRAILPRPSCSTVPLAIFKGDSTNSNYSAVTTWNIGLAQGVLVFDKTLCPN